MDPIGLVESEAKVEHDAKWCMVTCSDLYYFKFSIAELVAVIVLFIASLSNVIKMDAVVDLSIVIMVTSVFLLAADVRHLIKSRDFRRIIFFLFGLECVVFITSAIVLAFWIDYENSMASTDNNDANGKNSGDGSLAVLYALDAIMLFCSISVTVGRIVLRARDRHIALQNKTNNTQEGISI